MRKDRPNDGSDEMVIISTLKGKKIFQEVYKKGRRFHEKGVQLIVIKNILMDRVLFNGEKGNSLLYSKISIGIPINKKYGNAISRNKAKRRIRSICRELLRDVEEGYSIIIRPSADFGRLSYKSAKLIFKSLLSRSGILQS